MAFHVGQKVICINADPKAFIKETWWNDPTFCLEKDAIYTIRQIIPDHQHFNKKATAIRVYEIDRSMPFWAERFRPLVERKTDISVFEKLLDPANHEPDYASNGGVPRRAELQNL